MNVRVSEIPSGGVYSWPGDNSFLAIHNRRESARLGESRHGLLVSQILGGPLGRSLSAEERRELSALAHEPNAEIFGESLLSFGRQQENRRHFELALACYAALEGAGASEGIRNRARERSSVLRGGGAFGEQVEFAGRQLADQALDPVMLAGMGVAGATFETVRLGALSRLAVSPASRWYTTGAGARALAWSAGFAAEFPAFAFSVRGMREALGQAQDWSSGAVSRDLWMAGITLFALKTAGLGARSTLERMSRSGNNPGRLLDFSQRALPQAAMFTGILGAHHLETALGFREASDSRSAIVQSLATLLQFNVSGRILAGVTGQSYSRYLSDIETRTRRLAPRAPFSASWGRVLEKLPRSGPKPLAIGNGTSLELPGFVMAMSGDSIRPPGSVFPESTRSVSGEREKPNAESLFQRIKEQIDQYSHDLSRLQAVREVSPEWGVITRRTLQNIMPLIRFAREQALLEPRMAEEVPFLEDILLELSCMEAHLNFDKIAERPGKVFFPSSNSPEIQRFLANYYHFTNNFINYLDRLDSPVRSLNHLRYAHNWLRKGLNIVDEVHQGPIASEKDFPYLRTDGGVFDLPQSRLHIVVMGDDTGQRTAELAVQGHEVIHIDPSLSQLKWARLVVNRRERERHADGSLSNEVHVHFVNGEARETHAEADLAERYYPSFLDTVPPRSSRTRTRELNRFLNEFINNKLAPRGSGFILTERDDVIEDLSTIINESPHLRLLEVKRRSTRPPLLGGRAVTATKDDGGEELVSWIVFRKRSLSTLPPPNL